MNTRFILLFGFALILLLVGVGLQSGSWGTAVVWQLSNQGQWFLPLITLAAVVDSINPCAISVLLITIAFLFSLGRSRGRILGIGFTYITGLFVIYVLIGLGILQALHLFNTPHFISKVAAWVLIAVGTLGALGEMFPGFPVRLKIPSFSHRAIGSLMEKATFPAAFFLGGLVGLCEFPCTGGPYLLVLSMLHDQGTYLKGLLFLGFYNLIFVLPLVVILLLASNAGVYDRVVAWKKDHSHQMAWITSLAAIGLGGLILLL